MQKKNESTMRRSAFEQVKGKQSKLGSKDAENLQKGFKLQKELDASSLTSLAIMNRKRGQWSRSEHPVGEYSEGLKREERPQVKFL